MVCHVGDLRALDVEVILDDLVELALVEGGGVQGGFSPDALAFEDAGDQADGAEDFNADAFHGGDLPADLRMHEKEVDHEVMAPGESDHRATEASGKPVGGDFEMKAILALGIGGDHALEFGQAAGGGFGVAIMTPAFGRETGELAGISGTGLHESIVVQFGRHPPACGGDDIGIVREAERSVCGLVAT